ncbi:hypothetical protein GCM10010274_33230 [Streptomyces lavendofoliae]|uniref:Uncharacterized protein n=1 Tax=Streptomyces lavendofoliae TaxID=67314 RepID=A0A918M5G5_9ACTN|nr:hypothetical protein GCM10010274_33230 [Streptomyces lavendofoliae]
MAVVTGRATAAIRRRLALFHDHDGSTLFVLVKGFLRILDSGGGPGVRPGPPPRVDHTRGLA